MKGGSHLTTLVQEPCYKLGLGGQERPCGRVGSVNIVTPWSLRVRSGDGGGNALGGSGNQGAQVCQRGWAATEGCVVEFKS